MYQAGVSYGGLPGGVLLPTHLQQGNHFTSSCEKRLIIIARRIARLRYLPSLLPYRVCQYVYPHGHCKRDIGGQNTGKNTGVVRQVKTGDANTSASTIGVHQVKTSDANTSTRDARERQKEQPYARSVINLRRCCALGSGPVDSDFVLRKVCTPVSSSTLINSVLFLFLFLFCYFQPFIFRRSPIVCSRACSIDSSCRCPTAKNRWLLRLRSAPNASCTR